MPAKETAAKDTANKNKGEIPLKLFENDLVSCMILFNNAPANPVSLVA